MESGDSSRIVCQAAKNLTISHYGASRFEVQGDILIDGDRRTVRVAVRDTISEATAFVEQHKADGYAVCATIDKGRIVKVSA